MTVEVHYDDGYDIYCPECGCKDWSFRESWEPYLSSEIRYEKYLCLNYFECGVNYWVERWVVKSPDGDVNMVVNHVDCIQGQKDKYKKLPSPDELRGYWLR